MELTFDHNVVFNTRSEVPLTDIAKSLVATEMVVKRLPAVLENLFPGLRVERIEIDLRKAESGSLIEDFVLKIIGDSQKDIEDFIAGKGGRTGVEALERYKTLISYIIIIVLLLGAEYAISLVKPDEKAIHIEGDRNVVVNVAGDMLQISPEKVMEAVEAAAQGKERRRLAKEAVDFFAPAKIEPGVAVTSGKDIVVSPDAVKEIPTRTQIEDLDDEEFRLTLKNVKVDIRVIDRDQGDKGWKAVIPELGKRRIRLSVVPTINLPDLVAKATKGPIHADVIVDVVRMADGEERPILIHLFNVHDDDEGAAKPVPDGEP